MADQVKPSCSVGTNEMWERRFPLVVPEREWLNFFLKECIGPIQFVSAKKLGGLVNSNFKVSCDRGTFFLRICNGRPDAASKEAAVLNTTNSVLPTARVIATSQYLGLPVILMDWIHGETLKNCLTELTKQDAQTVAKNLGRLLADFHTFRYRGNGFLDGNATIETPFEMNSDAYSSYLERGLEVASRRIRIKTANRVLKFIKTTAKVMDGWPTDGCLVHGDFHPDNILINKQREVVGIIDWESAMAWQPVHDIAHVLRRPMNFKDEFEASLLHSYGENGGWIPDEWELVMKLLQLLGWIDKLANNERRSRVIKSANLAIEAIVA